MKVNKPSQWEEALVETYQKKAILFREMYEADTFKKTSKKETEKAIKKPFCLKTFLSKIIKFFKNIF